MLGLGAGGNLFIAADSFSFFIKQVVFVFFCCCRLGRAELIKARVMSVAGRDGGGIYFLAILASGCLRGNLTICQRVIGLLAWLLCLRLLLILTSSVPL